MGNWPTCPSDDMPCWDGSDRETDCSCAASPYAACPATPCEFGAQRDPKTCECPIVNIKPIEQEDIGAADEPASVPAQDLESDVPAETATD